MSTSMSLRKWVVVIAAGLITLTSPVVAQAAPGSARSSPTGCRPVRIHTSSRPRPMATSGSRSKERSTRSRSRHPARSHVSRREATSPSSPCATAASPMTSCKVPTRSSTSATTMDSCVGSRPRERSSPASRRVERCSAIRSMASRLTRPASGSPTSSTTGSVASTSSPLRARTRSRTSRLPGSATSRWLRTGRCGSPDPVRIGEIDPAVGVVSTTPLSAEGERITVAPNGTVWVTEIFVDLIAPADAERIRPPRPRRVPDRGGRHPAGHRRGPRWQRLVHAEPPRQHRSDHPGRCDHRGLQGDRLRRPEATRPGRDRDRCERQPLVRRIADGQGRQPQVALTGMNQRLVTRRGPSGRVGPEWRRLCPISTNSLLGWHATLRGCVHCLEGVTYAPKWHPLWGLRATRFRRGPRRRRGPGDARQLKTRTSSRGSAQPVAEIVPDSPTSLRKAGSCVTAKGLSTVRLFGQYLPTDRY